MTRWYIRRMGCEHEHNYSMWRTTGYPFLGSQSISRVQSLLSCTKLRATLWLEVADKPFSRGSNMWIYWIYKGLSPPAADPSTVKGTGHWWYASKWYACTFKPLGWRLRLLPQTNTFDHCKACYVYMYLYVSLWCSTYNVCHAMQCNAIQWNGIVWYGFMVCFFV